MGRRRGDGGHQAGDRMRAQLRALAQENEQFIEAGFYRRTDGTKVLIGDAVRAAREGTRLYGPEPVVVPATEPAATRFAVTGGSSLWEARQLPEPVAVLNFASARNPGGGYLNGAQAQEEALCRASALYTCLLEAPAYYEHHRAVRDPFYSDRVIHSPGVPVFRDDRGHLLDEPVEVGFVTSPAPNAGVIRQQVPERKDEIPAALATRAARVLETAAANGYRNLVLGAWGCGVFQNDPAMVAGSFRDLLGPGGRFEGTFEQVVFGILDRTPGAVVRQAFEDAFADQLTSS